MMNWRVVEKFPNYSVSDCGMVKNNTTGRVLKNQRNTDGYFVVSLPTEKGFRTFRVHRLVADAFLPPPNEGQTEVAHNDGTTTRNDVANLRWATKAENQRDRLAHGTHSRGERQHKAVFSDEQAEAIRVGRIGAGMNNSELARALHVSHETIRALRARETYRTGA